MKAWIERVKKNNKGRNPAKVITMIIVLIPLVLISLSLEAIRDLCDFLNDKVNDVGLRSKFARWVDN